MKKVIPLFLALLMCLSLCSCGKSEAVTNVEALIEAIGIMRDGEVYHYHRTLLIDCYIKRKNNLDEEIKLGLGERTVNKYRQQACAEFAECFEGVKARRGLNIAGVLVETCGECAV